MGLCFRIRAFVNSDLRELVLFWLFMIMVMNSAYDK